jgi:hypothetical protein
VTVHDQEIVLTVLRLCRLSAAYLAFERPLRGIVLQQVREVIRGNEVVDRDDVDFFAEKALIANSPKYKPANATETVNANFSHRMNGFVARIICSPGKSCAAVFAICDAFFAELRLLRE